MAKDGDMSEVSYIFGILSIVFAFFQPIAGLIMGIIGIFQSKKQKTHLSERAKKLSIIGIIISIIFFVITVGATTYLTLKGIQNPLA